MSALSSLLSSPVVIGFDRSIDRRAARFRGNAMVDRAMYGLSEAANHSVLWHGINLADAVLGGPTHRQPALRRSVILAVEQALVNGVVKSLVRRDRPALVESGRHRLRRPRTSSFPSGHASAGACAATLLSADLGMDTMWWSTAGVVAWSRIHVGVHHGSDVLAGLLTGRILALAARQLWPSPQERSSRNRARVETLGLRHGLRGA